MRANEAGAASGVRSRSRPDAEAWHWFWHSPLGFVALAVGSVLLWLPALRLPIDVDAAFYAVAAHWWARGGTLYESFTIPRPQGIFLIYRLSEAIGLGSAAGLRVTGALFCAGATLLICAITGRIWDRAVGFWSAALFAAIMALPVLEGPTANAEVFMLVPLLSSLYLLLRADEARLGGRRNLLLLIAVGLCAAVALVIKPSAVVILPFVACWLLRRRHVERAPWRGWIAAELVFGLSFICGLAPALIHGLLTAPDIYLNAVLFHRLRTQSGLSQSIVAQFGHFLYMSGQIVLRLPILLLAVGGVRAVWRAADTRGRDFLILWLLTSLAGAWLGGNWWLHYYQQLLPPLAVAVVLGLRRIPWGMGHGLRVAVQHGFVAVSAVSLGLTLLFGLTVRNDSTDVLIGYAPSPRGFEPVSSYLQAHSLPGDSLYVAYEQPEIYHLTLLRPVTRWPGLPDLLTVPGAIEEQLALLTDPRTAPTYIVEAQRFDRLGPEANAAMRGLIAQNYERVAVVDGTAIYRRIE